MANAHGEWTEAIYSALSANSTLTGLCSIYNGAPQNSTPPYVDIGEGQEVDWGTKSSVGGEQFKTIHVWTKSSALAWTIMNQLDVTLHEQDLTVTGVNFIDGRRQDKQVFRDADGVTWHGVYRYRALTQDA